MDTIDRRFRKGFNYAAQLYREDRLDECVGWTRGLLHDSAIPRYFRIKLLLLLSSTLGDWPEAQKCYVLAESLWRITRRWHPEGEDEIIDQSLEQLREDLVELREALDGDEDAQRPENSEAAVSELVAQHHARVADEKAMIQNEVAVDEDAAKTATTSLPDPATASEVPQEVVVDEDAAKTSAHQA
jgi:hypothetical protein